MRTNTHEGWRRVAVREKGGGSGGDCNDCVHALLIQNDLKGYRALCGMQRNDTDADGVVGGDWEGLLQVAASIVAALLKDGFVVKPYHIIAAINLPAPSRC